MSWLTIRDTSNSLIWELQKVSRTQVSDISIDIASSKTFTIIGTPHYMAPEVISGKGYGYFADLWSVGVCLYEFICGGLPFGEEADDPFEIYKEIIKKPITYPHFMADKTAKTIIEQLMNKIPEVRLGGSYTTLKNHVWFKDFNWVRVKV